MIQGLLLDKMIANDLLSAAADLILVFIQSTDRCILNLERKGSEPKLCEGY